MRPETLHYHSGSQPGPLCPPGDMATSGTFLAVTLGVGWGVPLASSGWRPGRLKASCSSWDGPTTEQSPAPGRGGTLPQAQGEGQRQGLLITLLTTDAHAKGLGRGPGGVRGVHARTHTLEPTELLSEKDDPAKPAASSSEGSPHAPSPGLCIKPGRGPSCLAPRNKALVPAASLTLRLLSGKVRVLRASKRLICRPLKRAWGLATL